MLLVSLLGHVLDSTFEHNLHIQFSDCFWVLAPLTVTQASEDFLSWMLWFVAKRALELFT